MRAELKLKCSVRTVARSLNRHGFTWRPVPKVTPLTEKELKAREEWVNMYIDKPKCWWTQNLNLCLDGVTLTKAPDTLTGREKHAAQAVTHMWMRQGERMDGKLHTYNRYGVQLGSKVLYPRSQPLVPNPFCSEKLNIIRGN